MAETAEQAKIQIDTLANKDADSVDSNARYMAYAARLRTALRAGQRYIAYVRILHLLFYALRARNLSRPAMSGKRSVPSCTPTS